MHTHIVKASSDSLNTETNESLRNISRCPRRISQTRSCSWNRDVELKEGACIARGSIHCRRGSHNRRRVMSADMMLGPCDVQPATCDVTMSNDVFFSRGHGTLLMPTFAL